MDILKYKVLPKTLTAYDFLKALAIVLMVVDHIGYFFFPAEMWFRIIGRFSVPIWLFLIGHAQARKVPKSFWIGGALVCLSTLISGEYVFPLTILFTLIAARLSVDWIMARALQSREALAGMFFILLFMSVPTLIFLEYGTLVFPFAMLGFMVAHKKRFDIPLSVMAVFALASSCGYALVQSMLMPTLTAPQFWTMVGGTVALSGALLAFRPLAFSWPVPAALRWPVQFLGRRTLEFYVAHLIAFRALAMVLAPYRFSFMDFELFAFRNLLRMFL